MMLPIQCPVVRQSTKDSDKLITRSQDVRDQTRCAQSNQGITQTKKKSGMDDSIQKPSSTEASLKEIQREKMLSTHNPSSQPSTTTAPSTSAMPKPSTSA
ncbi:unnamed protein product [Caenorhabditis nigoni]